MAVARATNGVTDWAEFTWVWMAMLTRSAGRVGQRAAPYPSDSQCWGGPSARWPA
jgi:hypothetical protein